MTEYKAQQFTVEPDPGDPTAELSLRKLDQNLIPVAQIAFGNDSNTYLSFRSNLGGSMTEHMLIDANGNVGIGMASTGEKLEVNGTVKATAFDGNLNGSQITAGTIDDARLPLSISRTADVDARFDPSSGHKHTGATGNGPQIPHNTLTEIIGADPGSTDAQTNKHVSNAQTKVWQDHACITSANPHGTTAAQVGAPVSIEGVTNAGGDIDLVNSNSITISGNNTTKQITIGETHSARTDNPHATRADQIDNQGGTNRITTQINASTGTINEARIDAAIARASEVSAKFDVTNGHDHDGVDSKKIPALSTTYFGSLDGSGLTNLNGSQITTGTVMADRIDTAILRTSDLAVPNGIATLDSNTLVVQDPTNATATPEPGKICKWGMSADLSCSQLVSTAATGIAPFVVFSTTEVANLRAETAATATTATNAANANYLYDGTAYRAASPTPAPNTVPVSDEDGDLLMVPKYWTLRTSAANNAWLSVTYGNGLFVAVAVSGTGNRVMTSPDGITWTIRASAADNQWLSVTYGNGLFVAVAWNGTGNQVMTSPNGITWTIRTSAANNQWNSVTYGNGLFVAVASSGTGNRVMTSPDGINWTIHASAADNQWQSVTYGNGLFVAVANSGTGNRVMTSPDGITWTTRTSVADIMWHSVTYGKGLFVAVASSGAGKVLMTSPDGVTWTIGEGAGNDWSSVIYGKGLFVAVGDTGQVMTARRILNW